MADAVKQAEIVATGCISGGGPWEIWRVFNAELVDSTGVVDSVVNTGNSVWGFDTTEFSQFGIWAHATSAGGTAAVQIEVIQSPNDTKTNYTAPATNGTMTASMGETATVYTVSPPPMPRMRIRVTGVGSNPADTVIDLYLFMQRL